MKPILLTLLLAATAQAQTPADRAISTLQSSAAREKATREKAAPELYPGEFDDVGPQFLLAPGDTGTRELEAPAEQKPSRIEAFADTQLYYTSNALLEEKGKSDTGLAVITLQAAVNLPTFDLFGGQFATKLGYRHQWWMYSLHDSGSQLNNFDFAVSTAFLQARHTLSDKWAAGLGLDYNRLLSHDNDWAEFYTELVPSWYIERTTPLGDTAQLTTGLYGAYHWTHTDDTVSHINDRLDTSLGLSYSRQLTQKLIAQPFYRLQWSHYTENSDRNDIYNTFGLSFSYIFSEAATLRAFATYENRNSTDDTVADYGKWDSGLGLTLSVKY